MNCPKCTQDMCGHQYRYTDEDYDGISEWVCLPCNIRVGRWTERILQNGEIEPRYGLMKKT